MVLLSKSLPSPSQWQSKSKKWGTDMNAGTQMMSVFPLIFLQPVFWFLLGLFVLRLYELLGETPWGIYWQPWPKEKTNLDEVRKNWIRERSTYKKTRCYKHGVEMSKTLRHKITFHAIIGKALTEFIHHNEDNAQGIVRATDFLWIRKTMVQPWAPPSFPI